MSMKVLQEVQQRLRAEIGRIMEDGGETDALDILERLEYIDESIDGLIEERLKGDMQPGDVVRVRINRAPPRKVLCIYEGRVDSNPELVVVNLGGRNGFTVGELGGIFVSLLVIHQDYVEPMTGLVYDPGTNTVRDRAAP